MRGLQQEVWHNLNGHPVNGCNMQFANAFRCGGPNIIIDSRGVSLGGKDTTTLQEDWNEKGGFGFRRCFFLNIPPISIALRVE